MNAYGLGRPVDAEHGQDRPEDLLLHERALGARLHHDGRAPRSARRRRRRRPTATVPAPVDEQALQARHVPVVDDAAEARAALGVGAVEVADLLGQLVDEGVLHGVVDEHVVGRDAGLAGVEELPPRDAAGRDVEVGAGVHVGGRLAAELERGRREVLGGGLGDDPADRGRAGEEDVVPALARAGRWSRRRRPRRPPRLRGRRSAGGAGPAPREQAGASSDGLASTQLPAASAAASGSSSSWIG